MNHPLYGQSTQMEVLKIKTTEKQVRAFAGGNEGEVAMTEEECRKLCKKLNDFEFLSGYENRVRRYKITDETVDRYGDIVRAKGLSLANFNKNPVVQFAHDYSQPPVGVALKTWYDKSSSAMYSYALFYDDRVDSSGRSDLIYRFVKSNGMRSCSIGFMPIKFNSPATDEERAKLGLGPWGVEFVEADLLEFSPVPVPANPAALADSFTKSFYGNLPSVLRSGAFTSKDVDVLRKYPLFEESVLDAFIREIGSAAVPVAGAKKEMVVCSECGEEYDNEVNEECPTCAANEENEKEEEKVKAPTSINLELNITPVSDALIALTNEVKAIAGMVEEVKSQLATTQESMKHVTETLLVTVDKLAQATGEKAQSVKSLYDKCLKVS